MSNAVSRGPLHGLIRKHGNPVGAIDLPDPWDSFVDEFNRRYASAGLTVECVEGDIASWSPAMAADCLASIGESVM